MVPGCPADATEGEGTWLRKFTAFRTTAVRRIGQAVTDCINEGQVSSAALPRRGAVASSRYHDYMSASRKIITAAEMDAMTPQQRADAIDAGLVLDWADVPEDFRAHVQRRVKLLDEQLHSNG